MRLDNRDDTSMRKLECETATNKWAEGSCIFKMGHTIVNCTATIEDKVPFFLKGRNCGWVTAEYSMLPRSTEKRVLRDSRNNKVSGRSLEIQRLIGRSLRAGVFLNAIGERTVTVDCDVIQADGGTRICSINGGFVALYEALRSFGKAGNGMKGIIKHFVAAVSIGIINKRILLDLNYHEDSLADVDMNIVMNDRSNLIEIQASAEKKTFSRKELINMYEIAEKGILKVMELQSRVLKP